MNKYLKYFRNSLTIDSNSLWILLIIVAVLVSMLPIALFGIPSGNDAHQHFQFAQIYYDSIISGNFFPSWSAFENYGFGGIGIRFYPPVGYYALAIARIITGNWFDATWLTFLFWMFLGCVGVYFWAKEYFSSAESRVAAILYALLPFHLAQIYQFFIYGEFVAAAIIPFCFLFLTRICRRKKNVDILCFSIAYALLILSHIPLTIIGSISLAFYALTILNWREFVKSSIRVTIAFSLGIFASSFHWIKIVMEMDWLNHASSTFSSGVYNYKDYFFPFNISFTGNFWATYMWLLLMVTFVAGFFAILPTIFLFLRPSLASTRLKNFRGSIITSLFALFMATPLSSLIWKIFPMLQKIQFPWRWFSIVSVIGVISFAGLIVPIIQKYKSRRLVIYTVLISFWGVIFFNFTQIIIPSAPIFRVNFEQKLSNILNEESFECWWTIWAKPTAFANKERVSVAEREVKIVTWERESREFEVSAGEAQNIRVATFYYPLWKTEINSKLVETQKAEDGTISIPLASEKANVKLYFESPAYSKVSSAISILTWTFLLIGLFVIFLKTTFLKSKETI